MLGSRGGLDVLGTLGQEMRGCATVGAALALAQKELARQDRGAVIAVRRESDETRISYIVTDPDVVSAEQLTDTAVAEICQALKELCGPSWTPTKIAFAHRPAPGAKTVGLRYRCTLEFNSTASAVYFKTGWLAAPVHLPRTGALEPNIHSKETSAEDVLEICVRRAIQLTDISIEAVAKEIGVSVRTLSRRLAARGHSYHTILQQARFSSAIRLLKDPDLPVTTIAQVLGYSETAAFSRAFHLWAGTPPSHIRINEKGSKKGGHVT